MAKGPPTGSVPTPKYRLEPCLIAHAVEVTGSMMTAANEPCSRPAAKTMARRIAPRRARASEISTAFNSRAKKCSTVWTTISPSLSDRTSCPSDVSHRLRSSQLVTLPLCAPYRKTWQRTTCGCELASVTAPNVAQRTCPQNVRPRMPVMPSECTSAEGAPTPFRRRTVRSSPWNAPPVESYPRYSRVLSKPAAICPRSSRLRSYTRPITPHMCSLCPERRATRQIQDSAPVRPRALWSGAQRSSCRRESRQR